MTPGALTMLRKVFAEGIRVSLHESAPGASGGDWLVMSPTQAGGRLTYSGGVMRNAGMIELGDAPRNAYLTHMGLWLANGDFLQGAPLRTGQRVIAGDPLLVVPLGIRFELRMGK